METLVTYLVAAMLAWTPASESRNSDPLPGTHVYYESIARDVVSVVYDSAESPLFDGPDGRGETAMLVLSVASFESGFQRAIDEGHRLGDHGRSYCLMQIRVGTGKTREGWTGPELIEDRKLCLRAALHILRGSFAVCRAFPIDDRLGAYATGHCFRGAEVSNTRIRRARTWWNAHPLPRPVVAKT